MTMNDFLRLVGICCYVILAPVVGVWIGMLSGLGTLSFVIAFTLPLAIPYWFARRRYDEQERAKAMPKDGWYYDPTEIQKP
jgi:hypothetical protein